MSSNHAEYFEQVIRESGASLDLVIALDNEFKDSGLNFETSGECITVSCYEHKPQSLIKYLLPEINRFINGWLAAQDY